MQWQTYIYTNPEILLTCEKAFDQMMKKETTEKK
jgi:hypothetical protein